MRFLLFFLLSLPFAVVAQNAPPAVGAWREHLPYNGALAVTATDNKIFCATPYSLFSVALDTREITRISKISGLSETGISTINYDGVLKKLVVAYTTSNIDVISNNSIVNIPDIKRENIPGDKTIYHIYPSTNYCYLSTGLGVIVLDLQKYEIKDSWFIGNNGGYARVNMFTKDNSFFYAATDEGLKKLALTTPNPADFRAWQNVSGTNGLAAAACKGVVNLNDTIIALQHDSLFVQHGNTWQFLFANGWPIISVNATENKLSVCQRTASGDSKITFLNAHAVTDKIFQQPGVISFPKNAIYKNGFYWIADLYGGLSQWSGNSFERYQLNAPEDVATGEMLVYNNVLYAAAGSVNESWNYQYNGAGIYRFKNEVWTNYNRFKFQPLDSLLDFVTVAVDPRNETIWGGSFGGGLLHIKENNTFDIYKQQSPLGAAIGDPGSYRVSGLAFDANNNLWIANYGAAQYLHVLKSDGSWKSFTTPFRLFENAVTQIIVDDADQEWIVSPKGNGLICFNHGASIDNTSDDQWKLYEAGAGKGNLPSGEVLCVAKDKNGFIWVGTSNGIGLIQCAEQVFNGGCEAVLPVTKDGSFANYLFKGEAIKSIAVDGADRKWVATKNGAWLIEKDGEKVLAHFTEENSALLSNDIKRIAVNGTSGEVFFATAKGICSFKSDATEAAATNDSLLIYPNPVPPGYGGTIAIKGLAANSFVKITEANGRLVYQAKALGGQAVWNGKDYTGRNIRTGVYLVMVTDENRQQKKVGKIVFINQ